MPKLARGLYNEWMKLKNMPPPHTFDEVLNKMDELGAMFNKKIEGLNELSKALDEMLKMTFEKAKEIAGLSKAIDELSNRFKSMEPILKEVCGNITILRIVGANILEIQVVAELYKAAKERGTVRA